MWSPDGHTKAVIMWNVVLDGKNFTDTISQLLKTRDTHGLPVEHEIDKEYGLNGPRDVLAMGIAEYNNRCRGIVMRYAAEWQHTVERMGRWIDFENDYKTLYPSFMESVWWVFSELYKKDLVYRGVKV